MKITRIIKLFVHWTLAILKSFFNATVSVAWGLAGLLLLASFIISLGVSETSVAPITTIGKYIMKYCMLFWGVIFIWELWTTPHLEKEKEEKNGKK